MIRNKRLFLPLGLLALALSVLLNRLGPGILPHAAFVEGLLLGLATALGAAGLVTVWSDKGNE
jgi:hypothetical protein